LAVLVGVVPDEVADGGGGCADEPCSVRVAGFNPEGVFASHDGGVGIIARHGAALGLVEGRNLGGGEGDRGACRQVADGVFHTQGRIRYDHSGQVDRPAILDDETVHGAMGGSGQSRGSFSVGVEPGYPAVDTDFLLNVDAWQRSDKAEVDGLVGAVVIGEVDRGRRAVAVVADSLVSAARRGGGEAHRGDDLHLVVPGAEASELVVAMDAAGADTRGGCSNDGIGSIPEVHGNAVDARLAGILEPVVIQVMPHEVADAPGAGGNEAEVDGLVGAVVIGEVDRGRRAVAVVADGLIGAAGRSGREAHRGDDLHLVVPGAEAGELVVAVLTAGADAGSGGGDDRVSRVLEVYGDTVDARLAGILQPVVIQVMPHKVADVPGARGNEAEVDGLVGAVIIGEVDRGRRAVAVVADGLVSTARGGGRESGRG